MKRDSLGWAVFRAVGCAARAFADAVDTEHEAPPPGTPPAPTPETPADGEPQAVPVRAKRPTEQSLNCPFCASGGQTVPATPTAKGRGWYRCENGHHFDRHQPAVPIT